MADMHLALKPGSDVALFNGLLAALSRSRVLDRDFIDRHTNGFVDAIAAARAMPLAEIASATGLSTETLQRFYDLFIAHERAVTVYSQGVNQSSAGTDKVNAIINCHLATGRIGRAGMGPFSVTGQPNAMGGREVGGLANIMPLINFINSFCNSGAASRAFSTDFFLSVSKVLRAYSNRS